MCVCVSSNLRLGRKLLRKEGERERFPFGVGLCRCVIGIIMEPGSASRCYHGRNRVPEEFGKCTSDKFPHPVHDSFAPIVPEGCGQ